MGLWSEDFPYSKGPGQQPVFNRRHIFYDTLAIWLACADSIPVCFFPLEKLAIGKTRLPSNVSVFPPGPSHLFLCRKNNSSIYYNRLEMESLGLMVELAAKLPQAQRPIPVVERHPQSYFCFKGSKKSKMEIRMNSVQASKWDLGWLK